MGAVSGARNYSLVGPEAVAAAERGLVSADWYRSPVPRARMRALMARRDLPALRDTLIWLALLGASGYLGLRWWGTWACVPAFAVYGVLYGSAGDSRWHECGHGTAFRTPWLNQAVYLLGSFMVLREPVSWRWSHTRHHSDTIVVGSDPEIAAQRGLPMWKLAVEFVALRSVWAELRKIALNVAGRLTAEESDYLPPEERRRAIWGGRTYAAILVAVVVWCLATGSILPAMLIGLPTMYGRWMAALTGFTQHASLAEDVLDHRRNCRTVRMNPVVRFIYWNMNYHVEHHMFPTVPYHQLPALHAEVREDMPPVYPSILAAYRELVPAVWRQRTDPTHFVARPVPGTEVAV